jgi:hypothetical protein
MIDGHSQGPEHWDERLTGLAAPDQPWQVQVDVYLEDDSDPADPKFHIECPLPWTDVGGEKYLRFENRCRPGFEILFHLHDLTGKGYTFPKREDEAVWSKIGNDCPDEAWGKNEVFNPQRVVQPDQLTLVVRNDNDKKENGDPVGHFRYTLNVTLGGRKPYLHLDPGGDDQNGAKTFTAVK